MPHRLHSVDARAGRLHGVEAVVTDAHMLEPVQVSVGRLHGVEIRVADARALRFPPSIECKVTFLDRRLWRHCTDPEMVAGEIADALHCSDTLQRRAAGDVLRYLGGAHTDAAQFARVLYFMSPSTVYKWDWAAIQGVSEPTGAPTRATAASQRGGSPTPPMMTHMILKGWRQPG